MEKQEEIDVFIQELKEVLIEKIKGADKIVIVPHDNADFDAIGSAIGLSLIAKKYHKPYVIIANDPPHIIEHGVKKIIDECKGNYEIVKKDKYLKIRDTNQKELFILTDVNKSNLVCVNDILPDEDNIIIIDHHKDSENSVKAQKMFIDVEKSSASEIITEVLNDLKIKIPPDAANYLYCGISLDTVKLTKNCKGRTLKIAGSLLDSGANISKVDEYFIEDYQSDRKVQNLIGNIQITNCMIALIKAEEDEEYTREELAKAADYALKYGVDASFSVGKIENNVVSISGRSKGKVDIGKIMEVVGEGGKYGGGNPYSGAVKFTDRSIEESSKVLLKELIPYYYNESK